LVQVANSPSRARNSSNDPYPETKGNPVVGSRITDPWTGADEPSLNSTQRAIEDKRLDKVFDIKPAAIKKGPEKQAFRKYLSEVLFKKYSQDICTSKSINLES
jgi:hypothetical protein